ncbi:hypothetical protein LTR66_007758 [Elasticomyces elasticus]|nr:hypothetical protein LTR50_005437 [Elasticomyces elasticus]KAK4986813.1 hypothetical protein LTR66_007758 [Elasticomyces elasticus]
MAPSKSKSWNPVAFAPWPVTIYATVVYLGLFAALLVVHHVVPSAPTNPAPEKGINMTQAWRDLQELSNNLHPYNSRRNDEVHDWLLLRIEDILKSNDVDFNVDNVQHINTGFRPWNATKPAPVTLFNDMVSNITFANGFVSPNGTITTYFEGTNIMVYVRGSEDAAGEWWKQSEALRKSGKRSGKGGVLVNAHYDSVATGFGATDDGVGVVSLLQLISYFTTPGQQPKKGIVVLFNNGEEDNLNGAHAFLRHPLSRFTHTFLNLEGAGAGGRATLFRSTDAEVTKFYAKSPNPFGSTISADGFKKGFVRSGTDYSVFNGDGGLRGLDVAFMEPRARYHTDQDDARDTSIDSLWHMLSTALATTKSMASDRSTEFDGSVTENGRVDTGSGSDGVWFDIFGRAFAVMQLHTLFAISVTLLVITPVVFVALDVVLRKSDRWYLFARKRYLHSSENDDPVELNGWRGFFRFPVAFVVATAAVVGLAFLLTKFNPYIAYSSEYSVWSMLLTAWFAVIWFLLKGIDTVRPSALTRMYSLIWLYVGAWIALVAATIGENRFKIGSGYFIVVYFASVSAALLISYIELFALPQKTVLAQHAVLAAPAGSGPPTSRGIDAAPIDERRSMMHPDADDEATETTSLLQNDQGATFRRYGRGHADANDADSEEPETKDPMLNQAYGGEQAWSSALPRWTWLLQFVLLGPINIILVGQIALLLTSALHQTLADGNAALPLYLLMAAVTVLILAPVGPFIHRFTYHVPTFLFLVFIGTLTYNLVAFPFSRDNRLKVYFIQEVELDSGINRVSLTGLGGYVQEIITSLPSAAGKELSCNNLPWAARNGLTSCAWDGLAPRVVPASETGLPPTVPPEVMFRDWLSYNISRVNSSVNAAVFDVVGKNTRACRILFNSRVSNLTIAGGASDPRFQQVGKEGSSEIRLWSREWEKPWQVHVEWRGDDEEPVGLDGKVMCLWNDADKSGVIPALDEIRRFAPVWSTVSKGSDGLVEGWKYFSV